MVIIFGLLIALLLSVRRFALKRPKLKGVYGAVSKKIMFNSLCRALIQGYL